MCHTFLKYKSCYDLQSKMTKLLESFNSQLKKTQIDAEFY